MCYRGRPELDCNDDDDNDDDDDDDGDDEFPGPSGLWRLSIARDEDELASLIFPELC